MCGRSNNSTSNTTNIDSHTKAVLAIVVVVAVVIVVVVIVVILGVVVVPQVQGSCRRRHVQLMEPAQTTPELVPAGYVTCPLWTQSPTQCHEPVSMPRHTPARPPDSAVIQ